MLRLPRDRRLLEFRLANQLLVERLATPPEPHLRLWLDEAVAAVTAPVDDVDLARLGVLEDEEVVADQLELEHGLVRTHRLDGELLRLDDHRLALVVHGLRLLEARPVVAAGPPPALLAVALHLPLELVDELVDRRAHVRRSLARAKRRALRPDRRLGDVVRRDRRGALDAELELDLRRIGQLPLELPELVLGVAANRVADVEVLALHLESHPLSFSRRAHEVSPELNLTNRPRARPRGTKMCRKALIFPTAQMEQRPRPILVWCRET